MIGRLLTPAALAAAILPAPLAAQGALGANFNEHFEDVDYRDLEKADAEWLRIFLPMPQIDRDTAAGHGATRTLLEAKARGYRTILSLKWPYHDSDFPEAGSAAYAREIARLDELLPAVMGQVDILVIGNEPYIESRERDRDLDLNRFYEGMARHVIDWRRERCGAECPTRLYMGALNRLDLKRNITESTDRWMAFVQETPELDGVDIHPHLPSIEASQPFLDYVLPRLRPDQTFLATEFSLVHWWKQHMREPVAPAFAERYRLPRGARNWQVIRAAIEEPFAKEHWDDFLRSSPWFETRKGYVANQMQRFRDTGRLAVATYGFKQGSSMSSRFGPDKTPWLLNSVFAPATIRPNPDGSAAANYAWIDSFRALQTQAEKD